MDHQDTDVWDVRIKLKKWWYIIITTTSSMSSRNHPLEREYQARRTESSRRETVSRKQWQTNTVQRLRELYLLLKDFHKARKDLEYELRKRTNTSLVEHENAKYRNDEIVRSLERKWQTVNYSLTFDTQERKYIGELKKLVTCTRFFDRYESHKKSFEEIESDVVAYQENQLVLLKKVIAEERERYESIKRELLSKRTRLEDELNTSRARSAELSRIIDQKRDELNTNTQKSMEKFIVDTPPNIIALNEEYNTLISTWNTSLGETCERCGKIEGIESIYTEGEGVFVKTNEHADLREMMVMYRCQG